MKVEELSLEVLNAVGGKENVIDVIHCMTRLRFSLKKESLVNEEEVMKIEGVISVVRQGGQFQVVIGPQVNKVYHELLKLLRSPDVNTDLTNDLEIENKTLWNCFTSMISNIFVPLLGIMAGAGILKGLLALLTALNVMSVDQDTYKVLYGISDSLFYFMLILVGSSAAKYLKLNQMLGALIGAALIYPDFIQAANDGSISSFLGIPLGIENYTSTIFPAIIAIYFATCLDKFLKKIIPQQIELFAIPALILTVSVPITLLVVGPIVNGLSGGLATAMFAIYNLSPIVTGLLLGGPWVLMVMIGLHWAFIPIFINNLMTVGYDPMLGLLGANQMAMAGALIGVALKAQDQKVKTLSWSTAIPCFFGISEPGIYGVLIPRKKPFIMAIIGGSIGGAIAGGFGSAIYGAGVSGIFQITVAIGPDGFDTGFYGYILSIIVGFVSGLILTLISESQLKKQLK